MATRVPTNPLKSPHSPVYLPVERAPLVVDDPEPLTELSLHPTLNRSGDDASNSSQPPECSNAGGVSKPTQEVTPQITWLERYREALRVLRPDLTDQEMENSFDTDRLYQALRGRFPTVPEQAAQFEALYWVQNSRMRASFGPRPLGS